MIKLKRILLITIVVFFSSSMLFAADYTISKNSDGTCEIIKYKGSEINLEIPSTIDGYKVTSIGAEAFLGCSSLESINIPESIIFIEAGAFYGCSNLKNISIDEKNSNYAQIQGVLFNKIQKSLHTFPAGSKIHNYSIPNGITHIGDYAFNSCSSLVSLKIPESVTSIGDGAFYDCSSLESINIPESVISIGKGLFESCDELTEIKVQEGSNAYKYFIDTEYSNLLSYTPSWLL